MKHALLIFLLVCLGLESQAQNQHKIDSLTALDATLEEMSIDKAKVLSRLAWEVSYADLDSGLTLINEAIEIAQQHEDKLVEADAQNVAGTIYADLGRYPEAVNAHLRAISIRESADGEIDASKLGASYHNLALVYASMDSTATSLRYQLLAYDCYSRGSDSSGLGPIGNYLGEMYLAKDSLDKAVSFFVAGNAISKTYGLKHWIAANTGALAYCAALKGEFNTAHELIQEAFAVAREEHNEYNMMTIWVYRAKLYRVEKNYSEALRAADSALSISTRLNVRDSRLGHLLLLAELHDLSGDNEDALNLYKQYQLLKDSILNTKNQQNIRNLELVYEKEKTDQQLEILREEGRLATIYVTSGVVSSVGFVIIAFLLFGRIKLGKKAGEILVEQKAIIESKNKDITDSINYARKIQDAVTPVEIQLKNIFADSFVFNRPRSIVTGDFWWMAETSDRYFIVVGDCSGHGVPGAFMSVMAASFLNGIIIERKVSSPESILFELNNKIRAALKHSGTNDPSPLVSDTIEIAICSFSKEMSEVEFASAGMPVTFLRKKQIIEYRGSEFRAGAVNSESNPYERSSTKLEKGDQLFLFSDGLLNLPGGDQKHVQDLLVSLDAEGTSATKALDKFVSEHCMNHEQPDDILVVGLKV